MSSATESCKNGTACSGDRCCGAERDRRACDEVIGKQPQGTRSHGVAVSVPLPHDVGDDGLRLQRSEDECSEGW
jgi:hypothetical protein